MFRKKYFSHNEYACNCCGVDGTTKEFKKKANKLRRKYGRPMIVNCAYRCEKHNKKVGGAKNSFHKHGMAFDIRCKTGAEKAALAKVALGLGWSVGVYGSFLHLDIRKNQVIFKGKY